MPPTGDTPNEQAGSDQPKPSTPEGTQSVNKDVKAQQEDVANRQQQEQLDRRQQNTDLMQNNYVAQVFPVVELRCSCGNVQRVALTDDNNNQIEPENVVCSNCGATPSQPMSHDDAHGHLKSWRLHRENQELAASGQATRRR